MSFITDIKSNFRINVFVYVVLFSSFSVFSQSKNIPLQTYYKTQFLKYSGKKSLETFYPVNESYLNLTDSIKDTTTFYYDFFVWFFQRNWLEKKEKYGKIEISPLVNFSYGKNTSINDTSSLYRNTRGVFVSGEFEKKLTYSFVLCENQSRFMDYQSQYFNDRGEFYDNDSVFQKVNAVIPAGARTKPFKVNGYDYAFSYGSFAYQMNSKIRIEAGNNQHFIGSGYRSLLLSDNSIYAPYLRFLWKISPKLSYQVLYRKHKNLFRKPATLAVESAYETKLFSANYLTYKPFENFSVSLFSAGNQLRTDSITRYSFQPQMFVPLPFFNSDMLFKNRIINGISGLNLDLGFDKMRFYGQIAIDNFNEKTLVAYQTGFYLFDLGLENLNFQAEVNVVPNQFYASENTKLAYAQYNLPLAHPKGNNFTEIYANVNYEFKRVYLNNSFLVYFTNGGTISDQIENNSIFLSQKNLATKFVGKTFVNTFEVGYRINKKYNPTVYFQYQIRAAEYDVLSKSNNYFMAGLKVNLFNQYLDF
ncbi:MAG: hypothetical protein V4622_10170 [Bacteroidota bacterium]